MQIQRVAILVGLPLLLWSGVLTQSSFAQKCGSDYSCRTCEPRCCYKHHCHRILSAPPYAPVLGSAPAMMAPIVFTPIGPTAMPAAYQQAPQQAPDKEALRDLLKAILQSPAAAPSSCNHSNGASSAPAAAPAAAPSPPQPMADDPVLERLDRISNAIGAFDSRLKSLEARVIALEK